MVNSTIRDSDFNDNIFLMRNSERTSSKNPIFGVFRISRFKVHQKKFPGSSTQIFFFEAKGGFCAAAFIQIIDYIFKINNNM